MLLLLAFLFVDFPQSVEFHVLFIHIWIFIQCICLKCLIIFPADALEILFAMRQNG